ncbi:MULTISPECIES: DNA mismatch repair protein MutS [unclassified Enterococcus]|uniref:DNA mismatch repair protein MutS n=1 Tax=unclassified Enterococcus TaxID=2608891 RepID=UPI0015538BAB|nr:MULTISPECIES: DNA mismatch repair protein MutS [unclassified Enterococcus]MBS7576918.1 DNA mismatch repair protein MutS [Enterococcus sp. MMGLQ5-2]MBS7584325.1 DNA mismatch repair protein MutS [Enterococcus sp. MMGLQ5-1]NPD12181.1 DNA mismatch repair protein MutS [Enterococcus sp. MMGLQ5-1]NPD36753.1 DNA mismatch repair protein MutS [Enterococcus sp. MMGLQ5-2]
MAIEKISPGMQQYLDIKKDYPDAFLMFRMGDFYELFYEDAEKAAHLLELTLTSRNKNAEKPIPMAGVPYHSAQIYVDQLIEAGYKVAIAEQMEDPKLAKGVVKREVVQVLTPGTATNSQEDKTSNNFLTAIAQTAGGYSFAYIDLATGELKVSYFAELDEVINECLSLNTKELILDEALILDLEAIKKRLAILISVRAVEGLAGELSELIADIEISIQPALNLLLNYVSKTQMRHLSHIKPAEFYTAEQFLKIDYFSKYNLELTKTIRHGRKQGTLFWLLDETKTAMGTRLLKQWIERPLIQKKSILERQAAVEVLLNHFFERSDLEESLKGVYDLERLASRVAFGNANPKDFLQLKHSLYQVPNIIAILRNINHPALNYLTDQLNELPELAGLIERGIADDAASAITEGGIIKTGYNAELDVFREAGRNGAKWISEIEQKEKENTGIKNLRIDYNRKDGYYFHVTQSQLGAIPDYFFRKATLKNSERFGTDELAKVEGTILEARDKSTDLEYHLFLTIREQVEGYITQLQKLASKIAEIDCLQSLTQVAENYHYVKPEMVEFGRSLDIVEGRHAVVEKVLGPNTYVPNSIEMREAETIELITGPNMSGKSTYMRQLALMVILAQIGSFVPASSAKLPIFDAIYTRIGASDDLISGQSTFMVEMMEANLAVRNATAQSLILFDELGRGTATYDGMALAQAIIEYLHDNVGAKTLFSTHYHELTILGQTLSGLKNVHVSTLEEDGNVTFLHKMIAGPADKSYGIHVAQIAGLPSAVLKRAQVILDELENAEQSPKASTGAPADEQLSLFVEASNDALISEIKAFDLMHATPLDAMTFIASLQKKC